MNESTTVLDPLPDVMTLDAVQTDRFGTFLATEASADVASTRLRPTRSPARRAIGGVVAAGVLAGGLLIANGIVGGPGPTAVEPAVAIEQADGWTTISISDPDATPAEIEAALEAVGIEVRVEDTSGPDGRLVGPLEPASEPVSLFWLPITTGEPGTDDHHVFYSVASFEGTGPGDLAGLGVEFTLSPEESEAWTITLEPADPNGEPPSDLTKSMAEAGVRTGGDLPEGTVSIKDGSGVEIVLYAR